MVVKLLFNLRGKLVRNIRIALLAALVCAAAAPAFAAEFVANGGFEDVSGNTSPNFFLSDGEGNLTGWTTSSNADSNNVLFASPTGVATRHDGAQFGLWSSAGVIPSPDGGNFVVFDGDPTPGARQTMSQTVSGLTAGETYTLTFDWAATQYQFVNGSSFGCTGCWTGATTNEMEVSLGGVTQDTKTVDVASQGFAGWMAESMSFTATSTSELLVFLSKGGPTSLPPVALLDGVSLTGDVPGAVPEPATWAMMGIGFAGLGLVAYRRRPKALAIG
jgi:PEP-CTERM motif